MASVRRGDQHGVDFLRPAQVLGRIECQRDLVLPGRLLRFFQGTSRQPGNAAVLRQGEARHQAFNRVQSKAENSKASQRGPCGRGRPRPRLLNLNLVLLYPTTQGSVALACAGEGGHSHTPTHITSQIPAMPALAVEWLRPHCWEAPRCPG